MRPIKGTYPAFLETYINCVPQNSVLEALELNQKETIRFFSSIPPSKENYAYDLGKWKIKEVLNHLIDAERIFAYRCLRFARKDETTLPSFEEDDYVRNAELDNRNLQDLVNEFETVRKATLSLFNSFNDEALQRVGNTASGKTTVIAVGYAIAGHSMHHMNVVKERYLQK